MRVCPWPTCGNVEITALFWKAALMQHEVTSESLMQAMAWALTPGILALLHVNFSKHGERPISVLPAESHWALWL